MLSRRALLLSTLRPPAPITLFRQGDLGVHTYRIPALLETPRGRLLAVADARHDNSRDLPGAISLVIRLSRDRGRTWTPQRTLRQVPSGGVGDPSLLLDPRTKRIWCFHAFGPPGIGFFTATPAGPPLEVHAIHSDDDGLTWSEPTNLTPQLMRKAAARTLGPECERIAPPPFCAVQQSDPAWHAIFATSGTHFAARGGRFIVPLVVRDEAKRISARNAYSDDGGKTWRTGPSMGDGTDESKAVELRDGTVLQNMRKPGGLRALALSRDGGASFEPFPAALPDPGCNAGMALLRDGTLVFTNANSATRRERLTLQTSRDGGRTWTLVKVLHAGPAAYSTVVPLRDGSVGVLYECGDKDSIERIDFVRVKL